MHHQKHSRDSTGPPAHPLAVNYVAGSGMRNGVRMRESEPQRLGVVCEVPAAVMIEGWRQTSDGLARKQMHVSENQVFLKTACWAEVRCKKRDRTTPSAARSLFAQHLYLSRSPASPILPLVLSSSRLHLVKLSSADDGSPYYSSHPSRIHAHYGSSSCFHQPPPHFHSSHPIVYDPHYYHHHPHQPSLCRSSRRSRLFSASQTDPDVDGAFNAVANAAAQAVKDVENEHHHQPDVSAYMEGYRAGRRGL
ncbi:hypothetical protein V1523DRAFT_435457 [Lipomyces doorenjongii]